jgi:hypothetical protein
MVSVEGQSIILARDLALSRGNFDLELGAKGAQFLLKKYLF